MPTIKVSEETWQRLQAIATPFRGSELGTPDKVIERLLDVYESEVPAPDRVPASARRRVRGARLSSQFSYDVTRSSAARKRVSRSITSSAHPMRFVASAAEAKLVLAQREGTKARRRTRTRSRSGPTTPHRARSSATSMPASRTSARVSAGAKRLSLPARPTAAITGQSARSRPRG